MVHIAVRGAALAAPLSLEPKQFSAYPLDAELLIVAHLVMQVDLVVVPAILVGEIASSAISFGLVEVLDVEHLHI